LTARFLLTLRRWEHERHTFAASGQSEAPPLSDIAFDNGPQLASMLSDFGESPLYGHLENDNAHELMGVTSKNSDTIADAKNLV
jgi:hypothetical protein